MMASHTPTALCPALHGRRAMGIGSLPQQAWLLRPQAVVASMVDPGPQPIVRAWWKSTSERGLYGLKTILDQHEDQDKPRTAVGDGKMLIPVERDRICGRKHRQAASVDDWAKCSAYGDGDLGVVLRRNRQSSDLDAIAKTMMAGLATLGLRRDHPQGPKS